MRFLFAVTVAALTTLACADVSHLGSYNYPAPITTDLASLTPKQTYTQSHVGPQIESIKSSIPLTSFTIHQNVGQGQHFGSQSYSGGQSSGAFNYNAPVQQYFTAPVHQQSYSGPSTATIQQTYSGPAVGHVQRSYLSPAPQQQFHSVPPLLSAPASGPEQQLFHAPAIASVQNTYLPPATAPVHQRSYSTPAAAPVEQQIFSAHVSTPVQQIYAAPAVMQQQSYSSAGLRQEQSLEVSGHQQQWLSGIESTSPVGTGAYNNQASLQQQSFSSAGQRQEQSSEISGHQQQSLSGIESTSSVGTGAYNYQAPLQQQSFPVSASAPIQQSFPAPATAPVQQTFPAPASVHQQSFSTSSNIEGGPYNYQPIVSAEESYTGPASTPVQQTLSAPGIGDVHQTVTGSSGGESGSYNYQLPTQVQQQLTAPVHQTHSVPAVIPVQLAASSGAAGVDVGSFNYQALSDSQGVEYSPPAPQKISLPTPVSELTAPAQTPEVGTVYSKNGGYIYRQY